MFSHKQSITNITEIRKFNLQTDVNQILLIEIDRFSEPMNIMLLKFLMKKYGDTYYFIIHKKKSKNVLGYIFAGIEDDDEIHIYTIAIRTEEESNGYAQKLLKYLIEAAIIDGIHRIRLEVNENNFRALQIYKKFNFVQISTAENYYDGKDNALIMIHNLKNN